MANEYVLREDAIRLAEQGQVQGFPWQFQMLIRLPPADVVPVVHGRWIWKPTKQYCPSDCWYPPLSHEETWDEKNGTWLEDEMYCSECDYHNYHEIKYNFCPNCGAKMDDEGKKI